MGSVRPVCASAVSPLCFSLRFSTRHVRGGLRESNAPTTFMCRVLETATSVSPVVAQVDVVHVV